MLESSRTTGRARCGTVRLEDSERTASRSRRDSLWQHVAARRLVTARRRTTASRWPARSAQAAQRLREARTEVSAPSRPAPNRPRRAEGLEIIFRPDPDDLRRPLREQRLAAGTAQAVHQAHVGQRGAGRARRPPSELGLANGDVIELTLPRRTLHGAGVDPAGPGGRRGDGALGYGRRSAGGSAGTRRRLQRVRAAHRRRAVVRRRARDREDRRAATSLARTQDHHLMEGRAIGARGDARRVHEAIPTSSHEQVENAARTLSLYPRVRVQRLRSGAWRST